MKDAQHFREASRLLNKYKLSNLLGVSSALSLLEVYPSENVKSFRINSSLNQVKTNLFAKAIFNSNSREYKSKLLKSKDFIKVFNHLTDSMSKSSLLDEVDLSSKETAHDFIISLAVPQHWFQKSKIDESVGLYNLLYSEIPDKYTQTLKSEPYDTVNLSSLFEDKFGLNIQIYFLIGLAIIAFYSNVHGKIAKLNSSEAAHLEKTYKSNYLGHVARRDVLVKYLERVSKKYNEFYFTPEALSKDMPYFSTEDVKKFLEITSAEPKKISSLRLKKEFKRGHISDSLHPLELFPVVNIEDRYIVPDYRIYNIALTQILPFRILEKVNVNEYRQTLGKIQEIYIQEIINDRLPRVQIIPEIEYIRDGTQFKGPDLTLFEGDKAILIESKAKEITLDTRMYAASESLFSDLEGAIKAIVKLKEKKFPDLINKHSAYRKYFQQIDKIKNNPPIFVCIIGESVMGIQELIQNEIKRNSSFELVNFGFKFCFLDIIAFSKAVEIASHNPKVSLYSILCEFYDNSVDIDSTKPLSASFSEHEYDSSKTFLSHSFDRLIIKFRDSY